MLSQQSLNSEDEDEPHFRKSSFSASADCVAIAKFKNGQVQVRDTKDTTKTTLTFTRSEWDAFLKGVRNGEFDLD